MRQVMWRDFFFHVPPTYVVMEKSGQSRMEAGSEPFHMLTARHTQLKGRRDAVER